MLPLQLVGTSDDEAHLAIGLAEEITTALARFRWMFVVSSIRSPALPGVAR